MYTILINVIMLLVHLMLVMLILKQIINIAKDILNAPIILLLMNVSISSKMFK